VDDRELGLTAAGDNRHHTVTRLEAPHTATAGDDFARELEARDVRGDARRRRVVTGDLQEVGTVEPCGADTDEQLPVLRLGIGTIGDLDPAVDDGGGTHSRNGTPTPERVIPRRSFVVFRTEFG
jgi:hypothetical protein